VVLCVLPIAVSACSSPPKPSASTTSTTAASANDRTLCSTVQPTQIAATTGLQVSPAETTSTKTTVTCSYDGSDLSKSVIILYAIDVTTSEFTSQAAKANSEHGPIVHLSNLGDASYYFTVASSGSTITTLVVLHGQAEIVITSTASITQNENLAQLILFGFSQKE
jgi:Tfp pilus assembly protein PilX